MKVPMILSAAALVGLSACTDPATFDPNAPDQNRTKQGALTGAVIGAIAGAARSDNEARGAILGAALGAAAGGLIGQELDRQESELRAQLGSDVRIVNTGNELIVTMPQDILFSVDSATLRGDLISDLGALADNLQRYPNTTVEVVGHTDNTGDAGYNQNLSQRRAEAVAGVLVTNGVASSRVRAYGQGETAPVADNLTDAGRAQNRRVEIVIRPQS